jgi:Ca-activated chloride channel family protein
MDHAALLNLLTGVDCNMAMRGMLEDGTAIGMGISNAVTRLRESKAKSKVIILLTEKNSVWQLLSIRNCPLPM